MSAPTPRRPPEEPTHELREVVPARAVLTELARGFLLVHTSNPERALQFATTFVRECSGTAAAARAEATRRALSPRRPWGTTDTGPVDPSNFPPKR
jgi:hypothetical protein